MKRLFTLLLILAVIPAHGAGVPYPCQKKEYSQMCKAERLKITDKRISIKCSGIDKADLKTGNPRFPYFSASLDQANTPYLTDLIKTARLNNRKVRVFFSCPADKNPAGCKASDCRRLKGVAF